MSRPKETQKIIAAFRIQNLIITRSIVLPKANFWTKKLHPKFPLKTVSSPCKPKTESLNPVRTLEPANFVKTKIFTQKKTIKSQGRRAPQKKLSNPKKLPPKKMSRVEPARLHLRSGRRIQMSKTVFVVPPHNCRLKNRCQTCQNDWSKTKAERVSKLRLQDFWNCCRGLHATTEYLRRLGNRLPSARYRCWFEIILLKITIAANQSSVRPNWSWAMVCRRLLFRQAQLLQILLLVAAFLLGKFWIVKVCWVYSHFF